MAAELMPSGLSANPGEVYSLQSRLVCATCWCEPQIKNPEKIDTKQSAFTITAQCHGKEETRVIQRSELVFTQRFFENDQTEE